MDSTKCFLKCTENLHEPLVLSNGAEVTLGRGPETKIKDPRCSRTQVILKADYEQKIVKVTQIGRNACGLNGMALTKDSTVTANHGDKIEILLGQYIHEIEFDPPPQSSGNKNVTPDLGILKKIDNATEVSNTDVSKTGVSTIEASKTEVPNTEDSRIDDSSSNEPDAKKNKTEETSHWESVEDGKLLIYTSKGVKSSNLIAAYDLDGTLIGTQSGAVFPKHKQDWKILYKEVPAKLKEMHEKSFKILIFTNQAKLSSGKQNINDFKNKIESIVAELNLPIQVFIATGYSAFRKPAIGMWKMAMEKNGNIRVNMVKSFYCGDAAGREAKDYLTKKDYSFADLLFAKNIDMNFETPEHHFLKKKMFPVKITVFDPKTIPCDIPLCEPSWGQVILNKLEVIILVGMPGSGKTHFAKTHLIPAGYVHINRDTFGSTNKCMKALNEALAEKQRVVVDNTNPDMESRARYIEIAKKFTPVVRCFIMKTSLQHAKHNNRFRQITDPANAVGDVVINTYLAKYQEPSLAEGFSEIIKINFWLTFKNPDQESLYKMFLLDN